MAAPTVSLYVPTVSATRMAPHPVHIGLDFGEVAKSIVNSGYEWSSVNSGDTDQYQVNANNLDAHETATGTFTATDNNVTFSANATDASRYTAEVIFPSVTIASGKAIVSATLEMYFRDSSDNVEAIVYGEDVDSAANFTTNADILGRTKTTANVAWSGSNLCGGTGDKYITSPDIKDVIQELYDRQSEFDAANVGIIIEGDNSVTRASLTRSHDFDGTSVSAKLNIEYADAPLLNEYRLDTPLADLTKSGGDPANIAVNENGSPMSEGTVGSLSAGEWGTSGGYLYVRLSDDANPSGKDDDYVDVTFDVCLTGDDSIWSDCRILWQTSSGALDADWDTTTDPRPGLDSKTIDLEGLTDTDNFNRWRGFNFNGVLTNGDHTITVTVINPSGEETSETTDTISVASDSRTYFTVGSGQDYADLAEALADVAVSGIDNIGLTVDNGGSEDITAALTDVTGDNFRIRLASAAGARYNVNWDGTGDADIFTLAGESWIIWGVEVSESAGEVVDPGTAFIQAFVFEAEGAIGNCLCSGDGTTYEVYNAYKSGAAHNGVLIYQCESTFTRGYSVSFEGTQGRPATYRHISVVGCTFGPSTNESDIRTTGQVSHVNVLWCDLTQDTSKSCLRLIRNQYLHAYGNKWLDGDNWIGNINEGDEYGEDIRIEANYASGEISFTSLIGGVVGDTRRATMCNNILQGIDCTLQLGNTNHGLVEDVKFLHNTTLAADGFDVQFAKGGTNNGQSYHGERNRLAANLFTHEDPADVANQMIHIGDDIFDVVANVFPATQTGVTQFALVDVSGSPTSYATLTLFEAGEAWASDNIERDVTPGSDHLPDTGDTVTTESGVYDDYYGNARDSTSYAGAVIAANPSSGGGSNRNLLLLGVG